MVKVLTAEMIGDQNEKEDMQDLDVLRRFKDHLKTLKT